MTNHTTTQAQREQFVSDMIERMASLARTLSDWVTSEPRTLGQLEQQLLRSIKDLGAALLAGLCQLTVPAYPATSLPCACGATALYQRLRPATVKTVLGTISFTRPYYLCPSCHHGFSPLDQQLELSAGGISAGLNELLALLGASEASFAQAAAVLDKLTLVSVCPNSVRDATEQLGQTLHAQEQLLIDSAQATCTPPALRQVAPARMYVSLDGLQVHLHDEGWKEFKLGTVYTTISRVPAKRPERLELRAVAHSFVSDLADAASFGARLWAEAAARGVFVAKELVVLGDGAHWIWRLAEEYFPGAVQILDWYHASEYIWKAAHAIYGEGSGLAKQWATKQLERLWEGKVAEVLATLQEQQRAGAAVEETLTYYTNQQGRMRYDEYRARGMQIGSGSIESGCKHVLAARLKQAGMIWGREGAQAVATVRSWLKSERWEEAMALWEVGRRSYRHKQAEQEGARGLEPGQAVQEQEQAVVKPRATARQGLPAEVLAQVRAELAEQRGKSVWRRSGNLQAQTQRAAQTEQPGLAIAA